MVSAIDKSSGQAIIELTVVVGVVLFIVTAAVGLVAIAKKEIKHDFLGSHHVDSPSAISPSDIPDLLKGEMRFFPKQKSGEILNQLSSEGWSEDQRLKVPQGLVVILSNGQKHMNLIESHAGNLGVYY